MHKCSEDTAITPSRLNCALCEIKTLTELAIAKNDHDPILDTILRIAAAAMITHILHPEKDHETACSKSNFA